LGTEFSPASKPIPQRCQARRPADPATD